MKNFFVALCFCLIIVGSISFIKNNGQTAKMTGFVLVLALLLSLLSSLPYISLNTDLKREIAVFKNVDNSFSESAFKKAIELMLEKEGIEFKDIEIFSSKNRTGSINIEKIKINGVKEKEKTESFIKENTGIKEVEVS